MKTSYLLVGFTLLVMSACMLVERQAAVLLSPPASTPLPAQVEPLIPTSTATPLPIITPSLTPTETLVPTETPRGDIAPTLPHSDVHFVYHGDRDKPYVALTFDLCQKPELPAWFDQGIYDVLTRYDVPATFFMGGDWMRTHVDETLLLASNPKFELGNHSWSHPELPGLSAEAISSEIVQTQDLLYKLTGRQAKVFRLPFGHSDDLTLSVIASHGLYTIQWDVETGDPDPNIDAKRINREVEQVVQNGSIIVMHANGRGWHTAEALPQMIEYLQGQGYTLVTVSQLLGLEPIPSQ
jgi:peptidoglycan/xylan/chitin deacetylase (PgdA/CDA1 family)